MTTEDRSPIERLENRSTARGAARMINDVHTELAVRRTRRRSAAAMAVTLLVLGGVLLVAISSRDGDAPGDVSTLDKNPQDDPAPPRDTTAPPAAEQTVVPSVLSLPLDEAIAGLAEVGYLADVRYVPDTTEADIVIEQEPGPGSELSPGATVELTVSAGAEQVVVPDLAGSSIAGAFDALAATGLVASDVTAIEPSTVVDDGDVVRTEPAAGSIVAVGSTVMIVVARSDSPLVAVPPVVTLFYDTAEVTLRNAGLEPIVEFRIVPFGDPQVGLVLESTPASFTLVPAGTEIVIVVGEAGPPPAGTSAP